MNIMHSTYLRAHHIPLTAHTMRVSFVYNPALDAVGHQEHISIYTPFGEAIDSFCTHVGIRQDDWEFRWWRTDDRNIVVQKHYTPYMQCLHDNDHVVMYCVPAKANN